MRKLFIFLAFFTASAAVVAQKNQPAFQHVEPPFWWVGMKSNEVQVLFHNSKLPLGDYTATTSYPGVVIRECRKVENNHYLFVTMNIGAAKAGKVPLLFTSGKKTIRYDYELRNKSTADNRVKGFNSSDVIYLIMPDRFANGDTKNDSLPGFFQGTHRERPFGRHGGDLKGISDHLDYIHDMGYTALWLNPVLENNQKRESYHGYAITDLYKVDARFGTNDDYLNLINKGHSMGLKMIQDMVMNHIGNFHWLVLDLPEKDWIHQFPTDTRSNYRGQVLSDPYRSNADEVKMNTGWFDFTMPDVNQTNPLFATYLIQNSLWWVEYAGIDGIRMDTYPYPDKHFMARWAQTLLDEYPSFSIVGEVWINSVANSAYWQKDMVNADGYQSHLPSITDFPLYFSIAAALNEPGGWDTGMARLYNMIGQDFIYPHPNDNLVFVDNHDLTRYFLSVGRDMAKFKLGLTFILTTRGVPQLYYGTELLMDGDGGFHPGIRLDFPGGWKEDKVNAFVKEGRTPGQNEAYDFIRKLLTWRKTEPAIHSGKLTHYIPEDNVYVYFRTTDTKTIMVIMNGNAAEKKLNTARFAENINGKTTGTNVLTGGTIDSLGTITVPATTGLVLELK